MLTWLFESFFPAIEDLGWAIRRGWLYTWGPRATQRGIKRFIQRGVRGWSDEDTWNFNDYLTRVIIDGVKYHREHLTGCPMFLVDDLDSDTVDAGMARWRKILDQIVAGFEAAEMLDDCSGGWYEFKDGKQTDESKQAEAALLVTRDTGMALFVEWYRALWS